MTRRACRPLHPRGSLYLLLLSHLFGLALLACGTREYPEYVGNFSGDGTVAFLDQVDAKLFYLKLQLADQEYITSADYHEGALTGNLDDFGQFPFSIRADPDSDTIVLTARDRTYALVREGAAAADPRLAEQVVQPESTDRAPRQPPRPQPGKAEVASGRDARLVGSYSRQEIMSSAAGSIATQMFLEIRADGTFSETMGDTLGGGGTWSGQVTGGAAAQSAEWHTQNGHFLVRMAGMPRFATLARYVIEPGRLLFVYSDNSRHLWYRR